MIDSNEKDRLCKGMFFWKEHRSMYKRVSYEQMKKREKRRRKAIRVGCALLMAAAVGTTSFVLAGKAWAAPVDPGGGGVG